MTPSSDLPLAPPTATWSPPEAYADVVRFSRRYLWIRDKRAQLRPLFPNRFQRYYLEQKAAALAAGRPPRFLTLKSRRGGITTWEQAENYHAVATGPNRRVVTLAHDLDSTIEIFDVARTYYRHGLGEARPPAGKSHRRELLFHDRSSKFFVGTAGGLGFGRGFTLNRVHGSEVAKWPGGLEDQRDLLVGLSEACSHGEVVLESTANGLGNLFAELCEAARNGEGVWTLVFLAWWLDEEHELAVSPDDVDYLEATLTDEERDLVRRHHLTPGQIAWRRAKRAELGPLFPQEYPEDPVSCFLYSGVCYFDKALVVAKMQACADLGRRTHRGAGEVIVWAEPEAGREYVIGGDASEGVAGGDFSAAYVLEVGTARVMAALHGLWRPHEFAALLAETGRRYHDALLAPEVNNHGHAVLDGLIREHRYPEYRIFRRVQPDSVTKKLTTKFGWRTDSVTRDTLLADLAHAVHEGALQVPDRDFYAEALTFVRTESGKYEAAEGQHDDRVMALGITLQALVQRPAKAGMVTL